MKYFGLSDRLIQEAQNELRENDKNMKGFYTTKEQQGLYKIMMDHRMKAEQKEGNQSVAIDLRTRKDDDDI